MRRLGSGLTVIEMVIVVAILGILGILLASATSGSTNVARAAIEQADVEARLANTIVVLRRELRAAGVRRLTQPDQSPRTPSDPTPGTPPDWQDGDILLWQQPVQNPPGSGIFYNFTSRQPFWGADRSILGGWNEVRFEQTDLLDEARYGVGGADLNGDGLTNSPPLRYGRLVKRAYDAPPPGSLPGSIGPQIGPAVVLADGVLDRSGTVGPGFFTVTETASGEGVASQLGSASTPGRGGTVIVNLSILSILREEGRTRVRALLANGTAAIRPRNVE